MFAAPRSNPIIASPRRELANSIEFISQNVVRLVKPLRKIIIPKRSEGDRRLYPPTGLKVDLVTPHTADLVSTATNPNFSYRARYWPKGQPALARECTSQKNSCRLEQLDLETTYYSIIVMTVSEDGLQNSASSENDDGCPKFPLPRNAKDLVPEDKQTHTRLR